MFGPGRYVSDPTEGVTDVKDLPAPPLEWYGRDHHKPLAHVAATSPLATKAASAPCTTWAI
jgi:hypothetical protein